MYHYCLRVLVSRGSYLLPANSKSSRIVKYFRQIDSSLLSRFKNEEHSCIECWCTQLIHVENTCKDLILVYNHVPLSLHPSPEAGVLVGNGLVVMALSSVWQMGYSP